MVCRVSALAVVVVSCCFGACGPRLNENQIMGDEGRLVFAIWDCISCDPVGYRTGATNGNVKVRRVEGPFADLEDIDPFGDLEAMRGSFGFESDDTAIMSARADNGDDPTSFWIDAHREGEAKVTVLDEAGEPIDSTTLKVFDPTKLELYTETDTKAPVTELALAQGEEETVFVKASCAEGELVEGGDWAWWVDDEGVAALWDPGASLITPGTYVGRLEGAASSVYIEGQTSGETRLSVSSGQTEGHINVRVQ